MGLLALSLLVPPVPASRPRVTRYGTYYGKNHNAYVKLATPLAADYDGVRLSDGPIMILIECVVEKPRTSKKLHPRGDVDNYAKLPLDIMTKVGKFWHDDDQVIGMMVFKRFNEPGEQSGTHLHWMPWEN